MFLLFHITKVLQKLSYARKKYTLQKEQIERTHLFYTKNSLF